MSWLEHHTRSEAYASEAEALSQQQAGDRAAELYHLAAEAEVAALNALGSDKTRTIGITAVSAVSLYFKAKEFAAARLVAEKWLSTQKLPPFAIYELKELLQVIHDGETHAQETSNV